MAHGTVNRRKQEAVIQYKGEEKSRKSHE